MPFVDDNDILDVFNYLEGLAPKWKTIGLKLGIPLSRLDVIDSNETNLDHRLMRMSSDWLSGNYDIDRWGPPTWKKLASVVEKMNRNVAKEIVKDHGGK